MSQPEPAPTASQGGSPLESPRGRTGTKNNFNSTILDTSTRGFSALQGMWKQLKEISNTSSPDLVLIDIKGTTFEVAKAFLETSHYFKALFQGEIPSERSVGGAYILRDRDPNAFQCLVTYLKYGFVNIPCPVDWRIIEAEAYFYGIDVSGFIPQVLELNVGGHIFCTTKSTLKKSPHFESLFSKPQELLRDSAGRIFLDQDPTHFGAVLSVLRNNPNWNFTDKSGLLLEGLFDGANHATITTEFGKYGIFLPHTLVQWLVDRDGAKEQQLPKIPENEPQSLVRRESLLGNVIKKVQDQKIK